MSRALFTALALTPAAPLAAQANPTSDWWQEGVCYEVFVRSFQDSDGDGVGDFRGLTSRLDYINDGDPATDDDLGATCIWLMPIMPSPSYHGYDVLNYYEINRDYGTLDDFREFLDEAHERGIHVLVDWVINHISSEHPYFRDALLDPESAFRDWFVWSDTIRPSPGWQAPVWHRAHNRDEYYYGLFWGGMPDYNLSNPEVKAEFERIARFWLNDVGVDGFRLDAVGHLFEGPNGEWKDGPGTHPWLREFGQMLHRVDPEAFTVGEVYDDIDAVLAYYPDQLTTHFMFGISDAIMNAVRSGSGGELIAAVERVQREVPNQRWAVFLRNHDQPRTLTDLGGDVARNRLAATLLMTVPGLPFVYYGEEIGMTGAKSEGDPRLRTPMQWRAERGLGFTEGVPWEPLPPDSFTTTVAAQDDDPASLLNHFRRLIQLRTSDTALQRGHFVGLQTSSEPAIAFLRTTDERSVLVVANLSEQALADTRIASEAKVLDQGNYFVRPLLGDGASDVLRIARDGRVDGFEVPVLAPLTAHVFELVKE